MDKNSPCVPHSEGGGGREGEGGGGRVDKNSPVREGEGEGGWI